MILAVALSPGRIINLIAFSAILFLMAISQMNAAKSVEKDDGGADQLFELTLSELMNVKVYSGNLTDIENFRAPVSITTITSSDILLTPARNLYDLLEVYVPGAIWMNHHDSPKLGLRGIIADRNYKFLLIVDGINMNQKARNGVSTEMENWDLSDIERIDVIRGAGYVTYGPGAIAGIINITTKNHQNSKGISANYLHQSPYNSNGINLYCGAQSKNFGISAFGSVVNTRGWTESRGAYTFSNAFFGESNIDDSSMAPLQDYFADYGATPQIKANLQLSFLDGYVFNARYSSSGSTEYAAFPKMKAMIGWDSLGRSITGEYRNAKLNSYKQVSALLKKLFEINPDFSLDARIIWSSENFARHQEYFQAPWKEYFTNNNIPLSIADELMDVNSLRNKYVYFSENELGLNLLANYKLSRQILTAFGVYVSYNSWGAPWGESKSNFRMGDKGNIISGTDSYCYNHFLYGGQKDFGFGVGPVDSAEVFFVGHGWATHTSSLFAEINYSASEKLTFLLSARADKDDYSKFLISPRLAAIYNINPENVVKLIIQNSQRMNTAEELFLQNKAGKVSDPENLQSLELIYSALTGNNLFFNVSGFYNALEVLSWFDPIRSTRVTGDLKLIGIEAEVKFNSRLLNASLNHSYVKQLSWELADGINSSGISYSDYNVKIDSTYFNGFGNDLNNWSNHSTKIYGNFKLFDGKLVLHADARIFWGFQGAKDGLVMMKSATIGNPDSVQINKFISFIDSKNFWSADFRLNVSVSYSPFDFLRVSAFVQNLLGTNRNYRYTYDAGNKMQSSFLRGGVIYEPMTFGLNLGVNFK